jgi:hypothetical protein
LQQKFFILTYLKYALKNLSQIEVCGDPCLFILIYGCGAGTPCLPADKARDRSG